MLGHYNTPISDKKARVSLKQKGKNTVKKSKTLLCISILIIIISSFVGCSSNSNINTPDEPVKSTACTNHLYWKDINDETGEINRRSIHSITGYKPLDE